MKELEARERRLLIGLAVILLAFLAFRGVPWLMEALSGSVGTGGTAAARRALDAQDDVVELTELDPELRDYKVDRNPFVYGELPPPPPPPRRDPPPEPKPLPPPPPRQPPPAPAPVGPRLPDVSYSFLGSFGPQSRRIGVLTDGETIYNVQKGEVVDGIVEVAAIGFETIELKYVDFPDQPALKLEVGN